MTKKIFLSYSTEDKSRMLAFKNAIKKRAKLESIVIADRRYPGKPLEEKVKEGIDEADYVVPILTSNSIRNQWVNQEIGYAEALKNKPIYPIVEKSILDELKGFIHKNRDLPHIFNSHADKRKEAESFRKSYKLLLDDISKLEKVKGEEESEKISEVLDKTSVNGYRAKDIPIEIELRDNTAFNLRVKTFSTQQSFIAYYLFETDLNETKWIGYTNSESYAHIKDNEVTVALKDQRKTSYTIDDKIRETIRGRFPKLKGTPTRIKTVRFRGDKLDSREINFYYGFSE